MAGTYAKTQANAFSGGGGGGGSGNVVGPAVSTDNALARFDGTTGQLIQNSVGLLSDAGALTGLIGLTVSDSQAAAAVTISAANTNTSGFGIVSALNSSGLEMSIQSTGTAFVGSGVLTDRQGILKTNTSKGMLIASTNAGATSLIRFSVKGTAAACLTLASDAITLVDTDHAITADLTQFSGKKAFRLTAATPADLTAFYAFNTDTSGQSAMVAQGAFAIAMVMTGLTNATPSLGYLDAQGPAGLNLYASHASATNMSFFIGGYAVGNKQMALSTIGLVITGTVSASNLSGTNTGNVTVSGGNGLTLAGQALSIVYSVSTKVANYTILSSDNGTRFLVDTSGGAFSVTLPSAASVGSGFNFYIADSTGNLMTNNLSVVPNGTDKISGLNATSVFQTDWGGWYFFTNGTDWFVI